jgi:hypothetical protein
LTGASPRLTASLAISRSTSRARRRKICTATDESDLFYPEHRLEELGARDGFAVLNLAPELQGYEDRSHAFVQGFPNTRKRMGHWNALGHRLSGELIAQRVRRLLKEVPKSEAR